jgi:hypothetical protein
MPIECLRSPKRIRSSKEGGIPYSEVLPEGRLYAIPLSEVTIVRRFNGLGICNQLDLLLGEEVWEVRGWGGRHEDDKRCTLDRLSAELYRGGTLVFFGGDSQIHGFSVLTEEEVRPIYGATPKSHHYDWGSLGKEVGAVHQ